MILNGETRSQGVLPYSSKICLPPLKHPLYQLNILFIKTIGHSSITYYRTYFIPLTRGIWLPYIATTSIKYWSNLHITIHFFVQLRLINSRASPSTNLCMTKSFNTGNCTDAQPLIHLYISANGGKSTQSNTNLSKPHMTH